MESSLPAGWSRACSMQVSISCLSSTLVGASSGAGAGAGAGSGPGRGIGLGAGRRMTGLLRRKGGILGGTESELFKRL